MTIETFEKAREIVIEQNAVSNKILVISEYLGKNIGNNDCTLSIRGVGEIRIDAETAICGWGEKGIS